MTDQELAPDPQDVNHTPVLLQEVLTGLNIRPGVRIIDATLGGGGHTAHMLEYSAPDGLVLGLDADPAALRRVTRRLTDSLSDRRLVVVQAHFATLKQVALVHGFRAVDAILLDLGLSSFQLETAARGFSFLHAGPLDMRFDPSQELSAGEIVNSWSEAALANLIYKYGEEHRSRRIARSIVHRRPVHDTAELAQIVAKAVGGRRGGRIHPATRTFQALRIAVNQELEQLTLTLPQCLELLRPGGRLAVISFHSLEDRIVKRWMLHEARDFVPDNTQPTGSYAKTPSLALMTRRPVTASDQEIEQNSRSRSAKLRIAERL